MILCARVRRTYIQNNIKKRYGQEIIIILLYDLCAAAAGCKIKKKKLVARISLLWLLLYYYYNYYLLIVIYYFTDTNSWRQWRATGLRPGGGAAVDAHGRLRGSRRRRFTKSSVFDPAESDSKSLDEYQPSHLL